MNTCIVDSLCDATATIEVKSPWKPIQPENTIDYVPSSLKDSRKPSWHVPSPDDDLNNAVLSQMEVPAQNQALISRLLESLETLKTKSSHHSSGGTSPSPLTNSAERAPSSPTEVIDFRYNFSPGETISREHSTDCLVSAVQQLSLNSNKGSTTPLSRGPTPPPQQSRWQGYTMPAPVGAGAPLPVPLPVNPYPAAQRMPQTGPLTPGSMMPFPGANPMHTAIPPAQFMGPANNPMAAFATYHALCAGRVGPYTALHRAFPPQPVFEECLVGIDGAYQPYCRQIISEELNAAALRMLHKLKNMQLADPPALTRVIGKRYFCSLKEVSKVVHGAKMLIVAPDVRPSATAHIKPVRLLQMVLESADAAGVPYVFALSRRGIGQVFGRDKSMSIVAVNYIDQVEAEYLTLLEQATTGRELYAMAMHKGAVRRF